MIAKIKDIIKKKNSRIKIMMLCESYDDAMSTYQTWNLMLHLIIKKNVKSYKKRRRIATPHVIIDFIGDKHYASKVYKNYKYFFRSNGSVESWGALLYLARGGQRR